MAGSEEDYQSQVEELVALQSICGEGCFRLLTRPTAGSSGGSSAADAGGGPSAQEQQEEHEGLEQPQEEQLGDDEVLAAMLGQPRPAGLASLGAEVLVDVELPPGGLQLVIGRGGGSGAVCGGSTAECSSSGSGDSMPVGEPVRWLPPLRVVFELPPDYPSTTPPAVTVRAGWLAAAQAAALEAGLLAAWCEQGEGYPVMFAYLEQLRESALSQLGVTDSLQLAGGGGRQACGSPGSSEPACGGGGERGSCEFAAPSAEQVVMQLLRYHASKEQEDFEASQQRCSVCFDEHPGSACLRLACRHHFCRGCLGTLASTNVKEGAVEALRCPDPSCRQPLPPHTLQSLLSPQEFERWEGLLLQRTLDRMQDLVYCPRCETPCIEETADHFAQCPECLFAFCSLCFGGWHPGERCLDEEQKLLIMSRRKARGGAGAKDVRAEMDLVQQLASLKVLKESSKPCPGCRVAIEKTEGCNQIICSYCGTWFCWRCEKEISGYEHFKEGQCRLFEQAEIDRWNAMFAAEREQQAFAAEGGPPRPALGPNGAQRVRVSHCPGCGQASFSPNRNNLVRCWSCGQHYCAACRSLLRGRVGQHYIGARACKQHG